MKKIFKTGPLKALGDLADEAKKNSLVLAYRDSKKLYIQNVDLPLGAEVDFDPGRDRVTFAFTLKDGEFLVLATDSGFALKREITR